MFTKTISKLNHKSILVIGMAREGLSTAEFLLKHLDDIELTVTDTKSLDQLDPKWIVLLETKQELSHLETEQVKGKSFDFIFKSPGIPQRILEEKYQLNLEQTTITSNTSFFSNTFD